MSNADNKTNEILVSVYGSTAEFGVGATTLADIERAIEARRELSDAQSPDKSGSVRRD